MSCLPTSRCSASPTGGMLGRSSGRGRFRLQDGFVVLEGSTDHFVRTPSGAAMALLGRTANRWAKWESKTGKALDALKRQSVSA